MGESRGIEVRRYMNAEVRRHGDGGTVGQEVERIFLKRSIKWKV